jgi:Lipoate-protein ligase A
MAIDEILLDSTAMPILRFYRWSEPAVSFGYFGKMADAEEFAGDKALVRRWTGGGMVPHGDDVTYSIVIGSNEAAFGLSSPTIYRQIHFAIKHAFGAMGIQARLVVAEMPKISEACFVSPVVADLIENGRKVAGAAQRRTRRGLLHQGSIQREGLGKEFRTRMAEALSERILKEPISASALASATALAAQKYATEAWLRRR